MPPCIITIPKKSVRFGDSQQLNYENIGHRKRVQPMETKGIDGPDEYTIFKGAVYTGYILNQYTSAETMLSLYGQDKIYAECHRLYRDLCDIVEHLKERPAYATYYKDYRFTHGHIPKLTRLLSILCMLSLDSRLQNILTLK